MAYPIARTILFPFVRLFVTATEGIERVPTDRPCIFAANHVGLLDPLFLGAVTISTTGRFIRFLVDPAHRYWRYLGRFTRFWTHAIPVDHQHHDAFFGSIAQAVRRGNSIGIFPEGEISRKPHLLQPKIGLIRIARETGAPIIPVGIRNTGQPLLSAIIHRLRHDQAITMHFGLPIFIPKSLPPDAYQPAANTVMRLISGLCQIPFPY